MGTSKQYQVSNRQDIVNPKKYNGICYSRTTQFMNRL